MKQPVQIDTFRKYRFLSAPAFSPDGQRVALIVKQVRGNGYSSDVYLYDCASGALSQATFSGDVRHFTFLADGTLLYACPAQGGSAFYALEGGKTPELRFTVPVKTLQALRLEDDRLLVLAEYRIPGRANDPGAAYDVFDELPFRWNGQGLVNGVRKRLYYCDVKDGALTSVTGDDFYVGNLTTSPWQLSVNERWILFIGQRMDGVQKTYTGLYGYDRASGELRCYLPDGKQKVELAQLLGDSAIVTTTDGAQFGSCQMPEFFRLDMKTGEMTLIRHYEYSTGAAITTDNTLGAGLTNKAANGVVYFTTMQGHDTRLRSIGLDGEMSEPLTPEGSVNSFDVSGEHIAYVGMYGNRLQELYLDGRQVSAFNEEIQRQYDIQTPVELKSRREGGEEVTGWVIPPVGYRPGTRYPAIVNIHGGPHAAFGPTYFHEMQVWASAGYFVFYCNPHGSDGCGNAFGDMRGIYGTIDYDDIMCFTDTALRAWPDVDPDRLGVTGGSYGGYMTNWIIGHTDRFRCAASQRSISDWALSEWVSDCGFQRNAAKMGGTALENMDKVLWHSPIMYSANVKTPTLFLHSYEDYRCHHTQAIAMFTAIRQRGVESRLCIFKGENHELSRSGKPDNRTSRMAEILSWMDKHLK